MTNTATDSTQTIKRGMPRPMNLSDQAPMPINRLSGWINVGEGKAAAPAWIIPTRARARQ